MLNKICPFMSTADNQVNCIGSKCMLYDVNDCAIVKILDAIEEKERDQ